MYKKILIMIIAMTLILTGCTKINDNFDEIINEVMVSDNIRVNTASTGYELYIPVGVNQISDIDYNQKFKIKDRYVYLYVDIVSYYYKNILNYKNNNDYNYYYSELKFNNNDGYVGINKVDEELYFCEILYNYSKVEFYSDINNLPILLVNSLIIQKNIKYNDELIKVELENVANDGREITYELNKPKDTESTFSKYLQEYIPVDDYYVESDILPDDD